MAFRLIRDLPGERRLLSPLPGPHRQARIDATVAAPGPHDFAVRSEHHSSIAPLRPSHPTARFVTIASRPFAGRDGEAYATNPNFCKQEYLCARGLTGFRVICPSCRICNTLAPPSRPSGPGGDRQSRRNVPGKLRRSIGVGASARSLQPQANCAMPWPTDQFSLADSRMLMNTSSGRRPGFLPSNSAVRLNRAFFWSGVRVSKTVIWM